MSEANSAACPNCGAELRGRFCHACGQDNAHGRLDLRGSLLDAVQHVINWDSALALTMRGLLTGPGRVAREYVAGKRKRYVAPAKLCLVSLALWLLVTRLLGVDPLEASGFQFSATGGRPQQIANDIRAFLGAHLDVLLYVALPLRAWLMRKLFHSTGDNLAECFVLVQYLAAFGFIVGLALAPLLLVEPHAAMVARQLLTFGWAVWAAREFFRVSWIRAVPTMLFVTLVHTFGTAVLFGLLALPFVL